MIVTKTTFYLFQAHHLLTLLFTRFKYTLSDGDAILYDHIHIAWHHPTNKHCVYYMGNIFSQSRQNAYPHNLFQAHNCLRS